MNLLAIDYGTKKIGLAVSINGIIFTLPSIKNDKSLLPNLQQIIRQHQVSKVYIGLSVGHFARKTLIFVDHLRSVLSLPVDTVEESVSTIEAEEIFKTNKNNQKQYDNKIDSIAAAVILRRVQS